MKTVKFRTRAWAIFSGTIILLIVSSALSVTSTFGVLRIKDDAWFVGLKNLAQVQKLNNLFEDRRSTFRAYLMSRNEEVYVRYQRAENDYVRQLALVQTLYESVPEISNVVTEIKQVEDEVTPTRLHVLEMARKNYSSEEVMDYWKKRILHYSFKIADLHTKLVSVNYEKLNEYHAQSTEKAVNTVKWIIVTNVGFVLIYALAGYFGMMNLVSSHQNAEESIAARDEFLSIASHDLKTPLTALLLQLKLLQRDCHTPTSQALTADAIKNVHRLNRWVTDLLDLTRLRIEKLKRTKFDVAEMVQETLNLFPTAKYAGLEHFFIEGDRTRLEQLVANLLCNAVKYGADKPVQVTLIATSDALRLVVEDQGVGIPAEMQTKIFDRFQRVAGSKKDGLGLGLYVARQIALAHRGRIWCKSELGKGSRFFVEIPI